MTKVNHRSVNKKLIKLIISISVILVVLLLISCYFINRVISDVLSIQKIQDQEILYKVRNGFLLEANQSKEKLIEKIPFIGYSNGYIHINYAGDYSFKIFVNGICARKEYKSSSIHYSLGSCADKTVVFKNIDSDQVFIVPKTGKYRIELWSARGGKSSTYEDTEEYIEDLRNQSYGKGAYTSGDIYLNAGEVLYVQVGGRGEDAQLIKDDDRLTGFGYPSIGGKGGYNGGGSGYDDPENTAGGGGGGATDIRLVGGSWNNFDSLKSRIMVAGGAGGMSRFYLNNGGFYFKNGSSGSGGTIKGKNGKTLLENENFYGYGSTQTDGYKFGVGENGMLCMSTINGLGGGAGGYYGSRSGYCNPSDWVPSNGAGGGSSYVSGCKGCDSISYNSTEENIIHTKKEKHYSGKYFTNIKMISGDDKMPNPYNGKTMIGNDGDGFARITYMGGW